MKFGHIAFAFLFAGASLTCAGAEAASLGTCVAIDPAAMKAGKSVYLLSSEFTIYDPASRDAAVSEWTKYATSRGFESMGCDPNSYHDEVAGLPPDTKVVASNWKPSISTAPPSSSASPRMRTGLERSCGPFEGE